MTPSRREPQPFQKLACFGELEQDGNVFDAGSSAVVSDSVVSDSTGFLRALAPLPLLTVAACDTVLDIYWMSSCTKGGSIMDPPLLYGV